MTQIDFRELFLGLPAPHAVFDTELRFLDVNDSYLQLVRRRREELVGRYVFDVFTERDERRAAFQQAFERALAGAANSLVCQPFTLTLPKREGGGTYECWFTCHHVPLRDASGSICGLVQQAEDVTGEVMARRMRDVLSSEFDHRVKNLLTTVASIARRTAKSATSTEEFVASFEGRIQAMAQTHHLLVSGGWDRLSLRELLDGALAPFRGPDRMVTVAGPDVDISGRQAQALGLAFHELAVNAAKHGALGRAEGRLSVAWSVLPATGQANGGSARTLAIVWAEDGLCGVSAPERSGFGTALVERVLPVEIGGSIEREFRPMGMRCTIRLPLAQRARTFGAWPPGASSDRLRSAGEGARRVASPDA